MSAKQSPSISGLDEVCTCFYLRRAARAISRDYDRALKPLGLKATQFTVLSATAQTGPVSITELAATLGMERTSLTRNLRPLEHRALLARSEEGWKRTRLVELTDAGRALLAEAIPLWQQAQRGLSERLGEAKVEQLRALLRDSV